MASVVIPVYCGLSGCIQTAKIDGVDCKNHPFHACTTDHADKIRTFRSDLYAEGRKMAQYWKDHWAEYANRAKFNR